VLPFVFPFPVIPLAMLVPAVVMFKPAAFGRFPVAFEIFPARITRRVPLRSRIWRACPVPFVQLPVIPHRIPITLDLDIVRPRAPGNDVNHRRRRGLPDSDSNGNLSAKRRNGEKRYGNQHH